MNKEPTSLYIMRFLMGLGLFAFMLMLYWSSELIESDMKGLRSDISQLSNEMREMRGSLQKLGTEGRSIVNNPQTTATEHIQRMHINAELPNLLQEDPFYAVTLPNMLGPNFKPHGTLHDAYLGKPENLHPFSNWAQVSAWNALCGVSVAKLKFGIFETFAPDMAIKVEERRNKDTGKVEFWIHLRDGVYWQPLREDLFPSQVHLSPFFLKKHLVTAHDFKFFYDAIMNPYMQEAVALRTYYGDIESIEVVDDLTFIVRWQAETFKEPDGTEVKRSKYIAKQLTGQLRPLASFVFKYFADGKKIIDDDSDPESYRTSSVWAQNFTQHWAKNIIVSCGPWIFDGMSDRQIQLRRNPDHYFPLEALVERYEWQFKNTPDAMWQQFKSGQTDTHILSSNQISELEAFLKSPEYQKQAQEGAAIQRLEFLSRRYSYIGWNEAKPYFQSKRVRQALTMGIDRDRIIRQNLNGLAVEVTGPFYRNSPAYDPTLEPWPYDPLRAKRLLEEEGWYDHSGLGIIEKEINGKLVPFSFSLTYYVKDPIAKAVSEYIVSALKELGIAVHLNGVDIADISAVFDNKNFDALYLAWMLGTPPEDPKQLWSSAGAKQKGSSNAIGFANPEADKIIDTLQFESNPQKRVELYHQFGKIIYDEAPYVFMYSPKQVLLYREYVQNVFIPSERQDLIPGANVGEPESTIFWLKR